MSTECIIILLSIVVVIVLGYVLKINYGFLGIAFAFICGCLIAGYSPSKVMGMWGTKVFFQMFSIAFFYSFAINNGTMELLARKLVYAARNTTFLIPVILFFVGAILAGIGPGSISMFLILIPIIMQVAKETKMHPLLAAVVAVSGINAGAWSPICVNGITVLGLIESTGYTAAEAAHYSAVLFRNAIIASFLFFVIAYVVFRGWKCTAAHGEKPETFNKQQKTSLILIIILTAILVVPPTLKGLFGGAALTWLTSKIDATFLAIIFGVISIILKVGDEKKAIASVPWKTIIMVCGVSMLISVASEAGATQFLSDYLGNSFSASVLPFVMALVAAIMSIFSSTMGVVIPTIFPIIFAICSASGADPAILFSVVPLAAAYSGSSPFSLFGGLVMSSIEDEKKDKMFIWLIIMAICFTMLTLLFIALGIINY